MSENVELKTKSEEGSAVVSLGNGDDLAMIAANAEKRIEAVLKIKRIALKVTNAMDWVNQRGKTPDQDKPYLQASGSEKIAGLFNISWRLLSPEPALELEPDGNYTYTYTGEFSMGSRTIHAEGSRSSRDKFFTQYEKYVEGQSKKEKLVGERDNKRDVKMSAYTNLLGNGITRILGIRNLTYADLLEFAGIKKDDLQKVEYKNAKTTIAYPPLKRNEYSAFEAKPEPKQQEEPEQKVHPVQPGENEPPDEQEPPSVQHNEGTVDGLRDAIRDLAATHFPNESSMALWLKTLTTNEEKGYRGYDSLDSMRSFTQLKFVIGALRREIAKRKQGGNDDR